MLETKKKERRSEEKSTHHSIGHEMMPLQLAAAVVFPIKFFHPWNIVFKLNEKKKHFTCLPRLITRNTLQFEGMLSMSLAKARNLSPLTLVYQLKGII